MLPEPSALTITVLQTLALLDGPFAPVASGVAQDRYALWLGSGISIGRVQGLRQVVPRVVEFVREQVQPGVDESRFRAAMERILGLASLTLDERARVDLDRPFSQWPDADAITQRLSHNYSRLLDIQIEGESEDYLLWKGVDIPATFADPKVQPDVEHLCVAILVLEGVASATATANWDGLVEQAARTLAGRESIVVYVRSEDLRRPSLKAELIKFHGCAVLAASDEATYRSYLVGRQSQINAWIARPENAAIVNRLLGLIVSKPTLMVGLSGQDANIQGLFAKAQTTMPWHWPGERPSFAFSENDLGGDQEGLLQNVYRADFTPTSRRAIFEGSLIRAYAKPLLVALVLHVLCAKLQHLVDLAPGNMKEADRGRLKDGLLHIRDAIAEGAEIDRLTFVRHFIDESGRAVSLFRDGHCGPAPRHYNPIVALPLQQIAGDSGLAASGWREAAVAVGVLGLGLREGSWALSWPAASTTTSGVVEVTTGTRTARVIFASSSHTALRLRQNGYVADDSDVVVVYGLERAQAMARSPRSAPGRTGHMGVREASIAELLQETDGGDELMQAFRQAVAI